MSEGSGAQAELEMSPDVIYGIARLALENVKGLSADTPSVRMGEIFTGRRAKGIQVELSAEQVDVDLNIRIDYGLEIPVVAKKAQHTVREAISSMTGLRVGSVNVTVEGVTIPEELQRGAI